MAHFKKITEQENQVMGLVRDAFAAYRRSGDPLNRHEMILWLRRATDYFTAAEQRQEVEAERRFRARA